MGVGARRPRSWIASRRKTILKIPVLPISYGDALPLLRSLDGPVAPEAWRGALPITYHVGAGPAKVHLKLAFDWQMRPLYNVIARIDGSRVPRRVDHPRQSSRRLGQRRGGSDQRQRRADGNRARAGELLKTGWRPKRTIILASWDGEEWGLLGSTEWVEKHQQELATKGGRLHQQRRHRQGLARACPARTRSRPSSTKSCATSPIRADRARACSRPSAIARIEPGADRRGQGEADSSGDIPIDALGSGSDYTAFLDHLTIASLNLGFGGDGGGRRRLPLRLRLVLLVHALLRQRFHALRRGAVAGRSARRILRLANADILPFEFTAHRHDAQRLRRRDPEAGRPRRRPPLDLKPLRQSIERLRSAADDYEQALAKAPRHRARRRRQPVEAESARSTRRERAFRYDAGPAQARLVQASRLRARLLHRLRRQDAARHPRSDRAEAAGRGAAVRPDRRGRRRSPARATSRRRARWSAKLPK